MKKCIFILLFLGFSSSCFAIYQPPTNGKLATLSVQKLSAEYKFLHGSSSGSIMLAEKDGNGCGKFSVINKERLGNKKTTVNISASQELFVFIDVSHGHDSCVVTGSFSPEEGKKYSIIFNEGDGACRAAVVEDLGDSKYQPIKLARAYASNLDSIKVCDSATKL